MKCRWRRWRRYKKYADVYYCNLSSLNIFKFEKEVFCNILSWIGLGQPDEWNHIGDYLAKIETRARTDYFFRIQIYEKVSAKLRKINP